jgi:cytochrome c biogenesis protein CcmG/thiol:disulfide interchange protein DsbE
MKKKLWNKPGFWISWAAIAGLIAIFAFGFSTDPKKVPSPLIGKPAPDFVVKQLDGNQQIRLSEVKTPVILNFWASWCVECRTEAHVLEAFHQKQNTSEQPLTLIGISIQDSKENARAFAQRFGKSYFLALDDPSGTIALDYGIYGVPETFFIDAQGFIRHKQIGGVTAKLLSQQKEILLSL